MEGYTKDHTEEVIVKHLLKTKFYLRNTNTLTTFVMSS